MLVFGNYLIIYDIFLAKQMSEQHLGICYVRQISDQNKLVMSDKVGFCIKRLRDICCKRK